jgi:two-component system cell cycle response regulator
MRPLVRAALALRRILAGAATFLLSLSLAALVVLDAQRPLPTAYAWAAGTLVVALVARRLSTHVRSASSTLSSEIDLGALTMAAAFFLVVRADRGLDGDAYPAVYVCLAIVSAFGRPAAAIVALTTAVLLEASIRYATGGTNAIIEGAAHAAYMAIFTGFNAAVLRTELTRVRTASIGKLRMEVERLRTEARTFRLMGPTADRKPDDQDRMLRSGVEEIHQSVLFALRLVREALGLHTAMLLWQNDAGTHLRISELVSDDKDLVEGPFLSGDGVFGAAISRGATLSLNDLKDSYKLPYYASSCPVRSVSVVPVHEHGKLRGLLIADRVHDRPFTAREEAMLEEASSYAVRAIHNERVFLQLERAKAEQGKLYRATEALAAAKTEQGVIEAGVQSAREITSVDYAALTLFDEATRIHEIRVVSGDFEAGDGTAVVGARFRANAGLVSMALENRHPLPYRGHFDEKKQVVFTRHVTPPSMPSIFVLPLVAHDRPLGALVLGSKRRGAFGEAVRATLEVLASHMAVSFEGARMIKRLEELATTDGMTGLLNKRAMLDVAEHKIAAAKRFSRKLAVLVTDIDHFKKVNDTYGHDVGDIIIKGLGEILRRAKRTTDAVARFGGEEFVVICEETDEGGALLLAERIRTELQKTTFFAPGPDGEQKAIHVTCSIGLATFPKGGQTWDGLFKAADTALYASKQGGRNRTTVYAPANLPTPGRTKSERAA